MHRIVVRPDQLRSLGARLIQTANDLRGVESRVGNALSNLDWEVRQKANVDGLASQARNQARALASQATEMGRYLERKAQAFEEADGQGVSWLEKIARDVRELIPEMPPWLWPFRPQAMLLQGLALGVSAVMPLLPVYHPIPVQRPPKIPPWRPGLPPWPGHRPMPPLPIRAEYERMSWQQRFEEEERIRRELERISIEIKRLERENSALRQQEEDITRRIAELERRKSEAERKARDFRNKIIPDTPFHWGSDDEGVDAPWRTQSDRYEDEARRLEQEIRNLEQQRDAIRERIRRNEAEINRLQDEEQDLKDRQREIDQIINRGIETKPRGNTGYYAGCTSYVASRREVGDWVDGKGIAYLWDESAENDNYELGMRPIKGSVMVLEKGVLGASDVSGHVAYVENVVEGPDGSFTVTTSEANTVYDENGKYVLGTWKNHDGTEGEADQHTYQFKPQPDGSYLVIKDGDEEQAITIPPTVPGNPEDRKLTFIYDKKKGE